MVHLARFVLDASRTATYRFTSPETSLAARGGRDAKAVGRIEVCIYGVRRATPEELATAPTVTPPFVGVEPMLDAPAPAVVADVVPRVQGPSTDEREGALIERLVVRYADDGGRPLGTAPPPEAVERARPTTSPEPAPPARDPAAPAPTKPGAKPGKSQPPVRRRDTWKKG